MPLKSLTQRRIVLDESALSERFVRASGPGGQNVNKVSSAVQLRFNARTARGLSEAVRARLLTLAGSRANADGEIVIIAQRFRGQAQNRADARLRLVALIRSASIAPKPRRKTAPSAGAQRRRRSAKERHSHTKRLRGTIAED